MNFSKTSFVDFVCFLIDVARENDLTADELIANLPFMASPDAAEERAALEDLFDVCQQNARQRRRQHNRKWVRLFKAGERWFGQFHPAAWKQSQTKGGASEEA